MDPYIFIYSKYIVMSLSSVCLNSIIRAMVLTENGLRRRADFIALDGMESDNLPRAQDYLAKIGQTHPRYRKDLARITGEDTDLSVFMLPSALRSFRPYPLPVLPEGAFVPLQNGERVSQGIQTYFVGSVEVFSDEAPKRHSDPNRFIRNRNALARRYQQNAALPLFDRLCIVAPEVLWAMETHFFQQQSTGVIGGQLHISQSGASDLVQMGTKVLGVTDQVRKAAEDRFKNWLLPVVIRFPEIAEIIVTLPDELQVMAWQLVRGEEVVTAAGEKYKEIVHQVGFLREELFFGRLLLSEPGFRDQRESEALRRKEDALPEPRHVIRQGRREGMEGFIEEFITTGGLESERDDSVKNIISLMLDRTLSLQEIMRRSSIQASRLFVIQKSIIAHVLLQRHKAFVDQLEIDQQPTTVIVSRRPSRSNQQLEDTVVVFEAPIENLATPEQIRARWGPTERFFVANVLKSPGGMFVYKNRAGVEITPKQVEEFRAIAQSVDRRVQGGVVLPSNLEPLAWRITIEDFDFFKKNPETTIQAMQEDKELAALLEPFLQLTDISAEDIFFEMFDSMRIIPRVSVASTGADTSPRREIQAIALFDDRDTWSFGELLRYLTREKILQRYGLIILDQDRRRIQGIVDMLYRKLQKKYDDLDWRKGVSFVIAKLYAFAQLDLAGRRNFIKRHPDYVRELLGRFENANNKVLGVLLEETKEILL